MNAFKRYKRDNVDRKPDICMMKKGRGMKEMKKENAKNDFGCKKKKNKEPVNITRGEVDAIKTLKNKIKQGELIVSQTDKSSRFAVLTKKQYLEAGLVHTSKDKRIGWKDIKYMQSQVNSHVWWLSKILGYAERTDQSRMLRNIQNHYLEVPDMALLVKDHKQWDIKSGKPVPTRPVVSGNRGVNTHLSEIISEFLEPLILEMGSCEIASTEEALQAIDNMNKVIDKGLDPEKEDILQKLSVESKSKRSVVMDGMNNSGGVPTPTTPDTTNTQPVGMDGMNNSGGDSSPTTLNTSTQPVSMDGMNNSGGDLSPTTQHSHTDINLPGDSDDEIIDALTTLFNQGGRQRGEVIQSATMKEEMNDDVSKNIGKEMSFRDGGKKRNKRLARGDIRHYFSNVKKMETNDSGFSGEKHLKWCNDRVKTLRNDADKSGSFNDAIMTRCRATSIWRTIDAAKRSKLTGPRKSNIVASTTPTSPLTRHHPHPAHPPSLQNFGAKPVLIGGDAVALYPSMDMLGTTEMIAETIVNSDIEFKNINLKYLMVYLKLVLGDEILRENGLGAFVPRRTEWKCTRAKSLSSQINREMNNWAASVEEVSWEEERLMVALMMKCAILALMDSTCYSFGGQLFKQMWGAGIGLRASACMAKIVMGMIDKMWSGLQASWCLKVYLFFRYIDDLRLFMHPITKGWSWGANGWYYEDNCSDDRSDIERTKMEVAKSLNSVTDFIQFTTEGEEEFDNNFLPTLDFQTQVQDSGKIVFKFFSKPMANNITIQYGTGLAKNTIFSALRQELVRRMLNCCVDLNWDERLSIIGDFIQLLINSGHRFAFVKSVTLQALTRYKFMIRRSKLDEHDKKYRPLYRARSFDYLNRTVAKMVDCMTWYKGMKVYDLFRNDWKRNLSSVNVGGKGRKWKNKVNIKQQMAEKNKEIVATMFVPPSNKSLLFDYLVEEEDKLAGEMRWRIKLIEQSGFPLNRLFIPKFPLLEGCPRGQECSICGNTGVKCNRKGVVYKATCRWCKDGYVNTEMCSNLPYLLLQEGGECCTEGQKYTNSSNDHNVGNEALPKDSTGSRPDHLSVGDVGVDSNGAVAMNGMNKKINVGGQEHHGLLVWMI